MSENIKSSFKGTRSFNSASSSAIARRFNRTRALKRSGRWNEGYSITEFGAVFYAFCICIVLPTICFLNFGVAFTYGFIASSLAADRASQAMNFEQAQQVLFDCKEKLRTDNVAQLIKITPSEEPFRLDLVNSNSKGEVRVITYDSARRHPARPARVSSVSVSGSQEDRREILQYMVIANFSVKPLIDLSMVPALNRIPIIGKTTDISFQHMRIPEHSEYWSN